jgi:hypothetical protein
MIIKTGEKTAHLKKKFKINQNYKIKKSPQALIFTTFSLIFSLIKIFYNFL